MQNLERYNVMHGKTIILNESHYLNGQDHLFAG